MIGVMKYPALRREISHAATGPHRLKPVLLQLTDGFGEGGDDFEEVAYDAVVGHFEDGGVFVLVDGDDGLAPFMPTRCWIAPEMPMAR